MPVDPVRATRIDEGEAPREIERRARQRFHEVGLHDVADDEPASIETLGAYASDGRSWVAVNGFDEPLGYVIVDVVDGQARIEQAAGSGGRRSHASATGHASER